MLDFDAAFQLSCALKKPSAVIIKHNNPCGVAVDNRISEAYRKARAADPIAAFGGVVSIHGIVDGETARIVSEAFIEGIVAKDFTQEALRYPFQKNGMRLLKLPGDWKIHDHFDMKKITGGMLIQDRDDMELNRAETKVVTKREPSEEEWKALEFAWVVSQFVKSNAIVFAHARCHSRNWRRTNEPR